MMRLSKMWKLLHRGDRKRIMATSSNRYKFSPYYDYGGNHSESKLRQLLNSFFSYGIERNEKLSQLEGIKTTVEWYKE